MDCVFPSLVIYVKVSFNSGRICVYAMLNKSYTEAMILLTGRLSFAATLIVSFEYGPRISEVTCSLVKTRRARDVTRIGLHPAF